MVDESLTGAKSDGGGGEPPAINPRARAAFTLALHRAIAHGGLGLERDLLDWFGQDRLTQLLDGAAPSAGEIAAMARLTGDPRFLSPTEAPPDDMEPIVPEVQPPSFPTGAVVASVSTSVAVAAVLVTGVVFQSAAELRRDAVEAEAFSARLVTTLAQELPHDANSGVFEAIAADALAHFQNTPSIDDAQTLRDWSRLFTIVGRQRSDVGDTRGAREAFESAVVATERRANDAPGDINAVYDHSQAVFWLADFNYRNGDFDAAETGYDVYASLTAQLYEADPDRQLYQAEYAYGYLNTSIIDLERGRAEEALDGFSAAASGLAEVAERSDVVSDLDVANAIAWQADALELNGRLVEAADERARVLSILEPLRLDSGLAEIRWLRAAQQRGRSLITLGRIVEANAVITESLPVAERRVSANPDSLAARRRYVALLLQRAEISLFQDNPLSAKLVLDNARFTETEGLDGGTRILPPREAAQFALLSAEIALAMGAFDTARDQAAAGLRLLDEIRNTDRYVATQIARAYETLGEAELGLGNRDLAERAWRQGLAALDEGVGHYLEDVYRARLAYRTGDFDTARASYARHQNLGYADPRDTEFWREASNAGVVQREIEGDMNDG